MKEEAQPERYTLTGETMEDAGINRIFLRESALEQLSKTRVPIFLGTYNGEQVYAAIFTEQEVRLFIDDGQED